MLNCEFKEEKRESNYSCYLAKKKKEKKYNSCFKKYPYNF